MEGGCAYDEPSIEASIPLKFIVFLLLKAELTFKANLAFSIHWNFETGTTIAEKNSDKYLLMKLAFSVWDGKVK